MKFKIAHKSQDESEEMTTPISGNLITWEEVNKMKFTTYFNDDGKVRSEINLYFTKQQKDWQYKEVLKLRQYLSNDIRNIRKIPDTNEFNRTIPKFKEWYSLARQNAKDFEKQCDKTHGHCKPGIDMLNRNSVKQTKFFCVPLIFLSYGELNKQQYCLTQFGNPYINERDDFVFDTHVMAYPLTQFTPKSDKSHGFQWGDVYNFEPDWEKLQ